MISKGEAERVARELLSRVVMGAYPPGVRLPAETELATELGCGRSTIREALTRLSAMGVVASRRGSGARVLDWRKEGTPALLPLYLMQAASEGKAAPLVAELLGMRRLLAREAVRLAVRYGDDDALKKVRVMFESSLGVSDPVAHVVLELEVFRGLVVASAMWPAVWLANAFWSPMRDLHSLFAPVAGGPPPDYAEAMKRLLDLVEDRREDDALRHVDKYLDRVDQTLLAKIGGAPEQDTRTSNRPTRSTARRRS
ncbi:MAG: FadR family transcriptional regulator [Polyangiaceae bacterium]|nr:FadR family transcriptional regulator [Polyangiaceae bacterium]